MIFFTCVVLLSHRGLSLNKINVFCLYSKTYDITIVENRKLTLIQKHPFADVSQNGCFHNIHRKTPVLETLFNKVAGLEI